MICASHVAILVPSVKKATDYLRQFNFKIDPEELWDAEGTKEVYVERDKGNALLLMEPIRPGAYQRALDKRGPGLHHLAIDVLNLESYIESLTGTGWLLHPRSLNTIKHFQTAYLARPGFPGLIEVQERKELINSVLFVDEVSIQIESSLLDLIKHIGLENIVKQSKDETWFSFGGRRVLLKDLL